MCIARLPWAFRGIRDLPFTVNQCGGKSTLEKENNTWQYCINFTEMRGDICFQLNWSEATDIELGF